MSLENTCDELLANLDTLQTGIPTLWPRTAPQVRSLPQEDEYYALNLQLTAKLNTLMYLHRAQELRALLAGEVRRLYDETFDEGTSAAEQASFLSTHTNDFKTHALMNDTLAAALPVVRAIYQGTPALTDAEFTVLNNLKKLYSHYNEHPANVRRLVGEQKRHDAAQAKHAAVAADIEHTLALALAPRVRELDELNAEYLVLQNTYRNQLESNPASEGLVDIGAARRDVRLLAKRVAAVSVLAELLPNLILCQATNWSSDEKLLKIMVDCQDAAENLAQVPPLPPAQSFSVDDLGRIDWTTVASALS